MESSDFKELLFIIFIVIPVFTLIVTLFTRFIAKKIKDNKSKHLFVVSVFHGGYGYYQVYFKKSLNRDFIFESDVFKGVPKTRASFDELGEYSITYDFSEMGELPDVYFVQNTVLDYVRNYNG